MRMLRISLVVLGGMKFKLEVAKIASWKSKLFRITEVRKIALLPDADGGNWEYSKKLLSDHIVNSGDSDFTVGIISQPLEGNYYMRRVNDRVAVISTHEMGHIVMADNYSIENYIIRNLYKLIVLFSANGSLLPADCYTWAHYDIRGCLFDMNSSKFDILQSMSAPVLCDECRVRISKRSIDDIFIDTLLSETRRLKKGLFFAVRDYIQAHPVISFCFGAILATSLNIFSNYIYDFLKRI